MSRRRGFTFTEILFAVLILGIGFILVAAIFPVALKQTQATSEETVAATIAKGGVSYLAKYNTQSYWYAGTPPITPADGLVHPIGPYPMASEAFLATNTTLWPLISGNLILPSDSRYAWVPMYRQVNGQSYVQVILIGVQARNRSFYDSNDLAARPGSPNGVASLEARPLKLTTVDTANQRFTFADLAGNANIGCVSDGAFVVVANDLGGNTNGWIYRVGNNAGVNVWNLAPGNDMTNATFTPAANSIVLVVGVGYSDASAATITYSGPVQDVAAYTTFITLH